MDKELAHSHLRPAVQSCRFRKGNNMEDRFLLAVDRIALIEEENSVKAPYDLFFKKTAAFCLQMRDLYGTVTERGLNAIALPELKEINEQAYADVCPENYETSFANPAYAVGLYGEELGRLLSCLYVELRGMIVFAYEGRLEDMTVALELFIEIYNLFEGEEDREYLTKEVYEALYYYFSDYTDVFVDNRLEEGLNPECSFMRDIVMNMDLSSDRYLYYYGEYIGKTETQMAAFLRTLPKETIAAMARTYTEGYKKSFEVQKKPLYKKKVVEIRFPIGFELVAREAILQFEEMGLSGVCSRPAVHLMNKRMHIRGGCMGFPVNDQYDYDHRFDIGLFLDADLKERKLSVMRTGYEKRKTLASYMAGPAVIELFGKKTFVPVNKPEAPELSKKQQKMLTQMQNEQVTIASQYINPEERSFTIISYPVPEISEDFEEIFKETIRLNNLDYEVYEKVQQSLIDALDTCEVVCLTGKGENRTNLRIRLHELADPEQMTNFENCLADCNIPLGEVFTSPVLAGTEGILHVSEIFLNGLPYKNLTITLKDGMITQYNCSNFENPTENQNYIKETILYHHDTLPIGEFAIGTNTTAYKMIQEYGIADKMEILIAEKTGPHFAFGDTCYSHSEDLAVFNPDGKEIIARDNEVSLLRKTDVLAAYFGCHTDVTVPYRELGRIWGETKDGERKVIFENDRYVLPGTEELNKALEEIK